MRNIDKPAPTRALNRSGCYKPAGPNGGEVAEWPAGSIEPKDMLKRFSIGFSEYAVITGAEMKIGDRHASIRLE